MGKLFELKISDFTTAIELSQTWATYTVSILDTRLKSIKSNLPTAGKNSKLQRYYFNDLNPNYRSSHILHQSNDYDFSTDFLSLSLKSLDFKQ